jgi:hypothetical protein
MQHTGHYANYIVSVFGYDDYMHTQPFGISSGMRAVQFEKVGNHKKA